MNVHVYLKHWWWFLISIPILIGAGYGYLFLSKPIYRTQASLLIEDKQKGSKVDDVLKEIDHFTPNRLIENEVEVLRSYRLIKNAIEKLNLTVRYYTKNGYKKEEIYGQIPFKLLVDSHTPGLYTDELQIKVIDNTKVLLNNVAYPTNRSITTPYGEFRILMQPSPIVAHDLVFVRVLPIENIIQEYLANLKILPTSKTSTVLQVVIEDAIPQRGEDFIKELVNAYTIVQVEEKNGMINSTLNFIKRRLDIVSNELNKVEKNLENYKSVNKITDISSDSKNLLEKLQKNDIELNQTVIQIATLNNIEKYIKEQDGSLGIVPAVAALSNSTLITLIDRTMELERQRDNLLAISSESNPLLKTLNNQIAGMKATLKAMVHNLKNNSTQKEAELISVNKRYENILKSIPVQEQTLLTITRQQTVKNNLYTYLLQKQEETSLAYASTTSNIRVIDPAHSDPLPIKPIKSLILLLFGSLGILIPVAIITIKNLISERVTVRGDIDEFTQVPILGEIVDCKYKQPIFITEHSIAAEQIRALRTNLQLFRSDRTNLALLTTSGVSGEGKSFLCSNLSASLALLNEPTVLLEMDFRKPELHSVMGISNTIGISDFLENEADLDQILRPVSDIENLWILTCGTISNNPTELLSNGRLEQLFFELRKKFTYIIVDAPPIGLVTDAQIISKYTDITLYMIRYHITPKQSLQDLENLYQKNIFPKLNLVLNSSNNSFKYNYKYYRKKKK